MLHHLLAENRETILALCAEKLSPGGTTRSNSEELEIGLPIFYDELIEVLRADETMSAQVVDQVSNSVHRESAVRCGRESLRRGYTISQVVHGYGALCQVITKYAGEQSGFVINAREFNRLNFCLDIAIAEAVTEFSRGQAMDTAQEEVRRLGFLAHELRNALNNAYTAHQMIRQGVVGFSGSTSQVLESALIRLKNIIDRSLSEVRLLGKSFVERKTYRVIDIVGEVEITAKLEAAAKSINLHIDVSRELEIMVDSHLVVSALSNLVQNAIKFTKHNGNVWIRARAAADRVLIEIEDECGGLPEGKIDQLFKPFTQKGSDRTGVGLGLSISRRAIMSNHGQVTVDDKPGCGCVFTNDLPSALSCSKSNQGVALPVH